MADYYLVIAPPKSTSTAFTRALAKNVNLTAIHEPFMPDQQISDAKELERAVKTRGKKEENEFILKMMSSISKQDIPENDGDVNDKIELYQDDMKEQIGKTTKPIVFIDIPESELYLKLFKSRMQATSPVDWHTQNDEVKSEISNQNKEVIEEVKGHFTAIKDLKKFSQDRKKEVVSISGDLIRTNPEEALRTVLDAWGKTKQDTAISTEILPVTERYQDLFGGKDAVYYLGEDKWVSDADRKKTKLEVRSKFIIKDEIDKSVDKILKDSDFFEGGYAHLLYAEEKGLVDKKKQEFHEEQIFKISEFVRRGERIGDKNQIEIQEHILKGEGHVGESFKGYLENLIETTITENFPSLSPQSPDRKRHAEVNPQQRVVKSRTSPEGHEKAVSPENIRKSREKTGSPEL
jgi:hypothetical protein